MELGLDRSHHKLLALLFLSCESTYFAEFLFGVSNLIIRVKLCKNKKVLGDRESAQKLYFCHNSSLLYRDSEASSESHQEVISSLEKTFGPSPRHLIDNYLC